MRTVEELAEIRAAALGFCASVREHGYEHTAAGIWALVEDLLDEIDELRGELLDELRGRDVRREQAALEAFILDEDGRPPGGRPQTG